jgi:hypothetical protein
VTLQPRVLPSVAIPVAAQDAPSLRRADIVVAGLEQAGPSFELRIFLNNPRADADTELAQATGYAGSIHVYGYGQPPAGVGARAGPHPRIPMTRYVMATEAVRTAAAQGPTAAVTLVAVPLETPVPDTDPDIDLSDVQVSVVLGE